MIFNSAFRTFLVLHLTILWSNVTGYGHTARDHNYQQDTSFPYSQDDQYRWNENENENHYNNHNQPTDLPLPYNPKRNENRDREHDRHQNQQGERDFHHQQQEKSKPFLTQVVGYPEHCVHNPSEYKYCEFMATIIRDLAHPDYVTFELRGKTSGYIAIGLSEDKIMDDDHIVECLRISDGTFTHYQSWSIYHNMPVRIKDDTGVVNNFKYSYKDGWLTCEFKRLVKTSVVDNKGLLREFDLDKGNHHILLAIGDLKDKNTENIGYHGKNLRYASPKISELRKETYSYYSYSNTASSFTTKTIICGFLSALFIWVRNLS